MDSRAVKPQDAPNLLFNIDLSNRGFWKERPGLKKFIDLGDTRAKITGLFCVRNNSSAESLFIICVYADQQNKRTKLRIYNGNAVSIFGPADLSLSEYGEPYSPESNYSFVQAGRFVYFCNGYGHYWELEKVVGTFYLKTVTLEDGKTPSIFSYLKDGLKPRSFTYFYDQIVVSGFNPPTPQLADLSIPAENISSKENNQPPREVLNSSRDKMTIDSGATFVSEPALWKSFPVEDPSGFYWVYNEDIIATAGINYDLLLFGSKRLYKITGHGTGNPRRVRMGDIPSVSVNGHCYFDRYVFFLGFDGCYITDGGSVKKVSFEMDPLWFGREEPQTTRYVEQLIQKGAYPFHVNRKALNNAICINDHERQQVMVSLPANDSQVNNMVWVYNYSDLIEGIGTGKWSIWGSDEEPTFSGTSLDGNPFTDSNNDSTPDRNNPASSPGQSNTTYNIFHWISCSEDLHNGEQNIYVGNDKGIVYSFGKSKQDLREVATYNRSGGPSGSDTPVHFPTVISLGRVGRVDSDGRIVCTDVAVRRKQLGYNFDDNENSTKLNAVVRSEGEGLKHFDVSENDVEFVDTILNSQQGVSENTKSVINTLALGASPSGSNAPLMNSEYFEAYARVNVPDEEGRAAYVDLYAMPTSEPHRLQISEVRVHANVKGGSQREQS